MRKLTRHIVLFLALFLLIPFASKAQWHKWHVGLGAGSTSYYGDISDKVMSMKLQDFAYHGFAERLMFNSFYLRLESVNGHIKGSDRAQGGLINRGLEGNPNFARSLNFRTQFRDLNFHLVYYLVNSKKENTPIFSPYLKAGVGIGLFDVRGDLLSETGDQYYYWSDLSIRNMPEDAPNSYEAQLVKRDYKYETNLRKLAIEAQYSRLKWQIPFGVGVKIRISEKASLNIEAQYTYAMTDYLDNVGSNPIRSDIIDPFVLYAADPAGFIGNDSRSNKTRTKFNDSYLYMNLGLVFNIGSTAKPPFKAPIFYPGISIPQILLEENVNEIELVVPEKEQVNMPDSLENEEKQVLVREELKDKKLQPFLISDIDFKDSLLTIDSSILEYRILEEKYALSIDSLYNIYTRTLQDSIISQDIQFFGAMLLELFNFDFPLESDSIHIYPAKSDSSLVVVEYSVKYLDSSVMKLHDSSTKDILKHKVVYRVDTLETNKLSSIQPMKINLSDDAARDSLDKVLENTKIKSSVFRVPSPIVEEEEMEDSVKIATDKSVGMGLNHLPIYELKLAPFSPISFKDTILIKDKELIVEKQADTTLSKDLKAIQSQLKELSLKIEQSLEEKELTEPVVVKEVIRDTVIYREITPPVTQVIRDSVIYREVTPSIVRDTVIYKENPAINSKLDSILRKVSKSRYETGYTTPTSTYESRVLPKEEYRQSEIEKEVYELEDNNLDRQGSSSNVVVAPIVPISVKKEVEPIEQDTSVLDADTLDLNDLPIPTTLYDSLLRSNQALQGELSNIKKSQESMLLLMEDLMKKMGQPATITTINQPTKEIIVEVEKEVADPIEGILKQLPVKVFFGIGQSSVSSLYIASLDGIAALAKQFPELKIKIRGYADPTGNKAANLILSEKRAKSVSDYITKVHKINKDRIIVLPVGEETDTQDMTYSRRVEVQLVK